MLKDLTPLYYLDPDRPRLTLDFETDTSHGDFGSAIHPDNHMLLACWEIWQGNALVKRQASWGRELEHSELMDDIDFVLNSSLHPEGFLVAHNAKYELMWLKRMGLDLTTVRVFDTRLAEYVLMGNLAAGDEVMLPRSTSLDACCRRRGWKQKDPVVDMLMKDGINPVQMPRSWLQGRCKQDVATTDDLFKDQVQLLHKWNLLPVLYTRCQLTPVLSDTEFNGMALDKDKVYKEYDNHMRLFEELQQQMDEVTGGINWRSSKQIGEFIYDELKFDELRKYDGTPVRTKPSRLHPDGARLTSKKAIEKLVAKTAPQKKFLALRSEIGRVNAALTKSLKFFKGVVDEKGGVFHAEFHQCNTATQRLSSTGVATYFESFNQTMTAQFQNLARVFKPLFKAKREGYLIAEADGSQLEFRVAVHMARDVQGRDDIISGHDVHKFSASVLNKVPESKVTKAMRQNAKADTFKPLYGGQSGTPDQQAYYRAFRERYPQIDEMQKSWISEVAMSKRLITEWGLRYYWPYARISKSGYVNVTTAVSNYPVQAFATAEIIPIALVYLWHRIRAAGLEDKIVLVNTVHDSVICEVHPDYLEEWKELAIQAFTMDVYDYLQRVYGIEFNWVPLGVGMSWGTHWSSSDNEEVEMNVYHDGKRELKA